MLSSLTKFRLLYIYNFIFFFLAVCPIYCASKMPRIWIWMNQLSKKYCLVKFLRLVTFFFNVKNGKFRINHPFKNKRGSQKSTLLLIFSANIIVTVMTLRLAEKKEKKKEKVTRIILQKRKKKKIKKKKKHTYSWLNDYVLPQIMKSQQLQKCGPRGVTSSWKGNGGSYF